MQETQEPLFDASDTVLVMVRLVTGFIEAVEFNVKTLSQVLK